MIWRRGGYLLWDIPGFARPTVEGHMGRLVLGKIESVPVVVMQGRFHYYEGYSLEEIVFPVRTLGLLGIKTLVLTNAAGGINVECEQGSLMVISDHLNLMGTNPLLGPNDERFGPRFPDMSEVYAREYQEVTISEAHAMGLELRRGIYAALSGPSYETPAEVRMLRTLGADAVGMSTVPEAIVARQMGIRCWAFRASRIWRRLAPRSTDQSRRSNRNGRARTRYLQGATAPRHPKLTRKESSQ